MSGECKSICVVSAPMLSNLPLTMLTKIFEMLDLNIYKYIYIIYDMYRICSHSSINSHHPTDYCCVRCHGRSVN